MDIVSEFEHIVGVSIHDEPAKLEEARIKLDAGLGAELLAKSRAKEQGFMRRFDFFDARYATLILGAYMMHVGAAINSEDRQHLKDILPKISSKNGYVLPLWDLGFRDPGQVQYKAALDNYVNGTPRSFLEARCVHDYHVHGYRTNLESCYNCGKISQDIAPAQLKRCMNCNKDSKTASYCNKACQKENWKKHKEICGRPATNADYIMMNV